MFRKALISLIATLIALAFVLATQLFVLILQS
ncbi:MAG TPA: hypothetical protein DDW91_10865 [Shewanella frigidimarina]|nr:hypothetical protein [Shewanella frigidimarina]